MTKTRSSYKSKLLISVTALTSLCAADVAMAQAKDEIIVTARRQAENILETPTALSAFTEDAIDTLGIRNIDDLARFTPGLSNSNAFGRTTERPVIRGAANILAGVQFGVESGVAYFVDGVYYSGDLQTLDTRGLARAEVIKGPQSALYGRNTYSGAINFITKVPGSDGPEYDFEALAAEDGEFEIYGRAANRFADDKVGVAVSGRYYTYDGDSRHTNGGPDGEQLGGEESLSFNGTIDIAPTDKFSLIARLGYSELNDDARPFALTGAETNNCLPGYRSPAYYNPDHLSFLNPPFAGIFPDTVTSDTTNQYFCGDLSQFEDAYPTQTLDSVPFMGVEKRQVFSTVKSSYEFDSGYSVNLQGGMRKTDLKTGADSDFQLGESTFMGGFVFPISPFFSIPQPDGNFSNSDLDSSFDYNAEIRIQSPTDARLRWSLGAFYYEEYKDEYTVSFANSAANNFEGRFDEKETVENQAVFGTISYDVMDNLEISAEARYQSETKTLSLFDAAGSRTFFAEPNFKDFIPKVVVNYNPRPNSTIYASWAEGLKPGGSNGTQGEDVGSPDYLPENSNSFEIGYKGRVLDDRVTLNAAAFYNDVKKYQLTTPVAGNGQQTSIVTNQGDAKIYGIELDARMDVTDYVNIGATYAWTNAEFTKGCDPFEFTLNSGGFIIQPFDLDDESTQGFFRNPNDPLTIGAGLNAPAFDPDNLFTGNASCSLEGNKIPLTSEHQFSAFTGIEVPISDTFNFFGNLDYTYESEKFVQVHNHARIGAAGLLGGNMGVQNDNWRFEIFARNITNERTPAAGTRWFDVYEGFSTVSSQNGESVDASIVGPRAIFLSLRRGRQIGARVKLNF